MIVDSRRITFSAEAIREAVKFYRNQFPQKQPPGLLGPIIIRRNNPVTLGISVQAMGARGFRELEMEESEIAALLIVYCRKAGIPLPRSGQKGIEAHGTSLVLTVSKAVPVESGGM